MGQVALDIATSLHSQTIAPQFSPDIDHPGGCYTGLYFREVDLTRQCGERRRKRPARCFLLRPIPFMRDVGEVSGVYYALVEHLREPQSIRRVWVDMKASGVVERRTAADQCGLTSTE